MRWPIIGRILDARAAIRESRAGLQAARERWPEVNAVAGAAVEHIERNHLAESITAALRQRRD